MSKETFDIQFDDKRLRELIKAFDGKLPVVKVGILGSKNRRTDEKGKETNASIGMKHEYGEDGLPIRSFLRGPISSKLAEYLEDLRTFEKNTFEEVIKSGFTTFMKKIGIVAELIVSDAFDTGGDGQWIPSNMERKKNHQTLVETQQLRNSITSEVK